MPSACQLLVDARDGHRRLLGFRTDDTDLRVIRPGSFSFTTKTPPASFLLKKAAKLKSGSKEPGKVSAGTIKRSQLSEIAEMKMKDLNANDIEAATKIIEGSARSMGLQVVEG